MLLEQSAEMLQVVSGFGILLENVPYNLPLPLAHHESLREEELHGWAVDKLAQSFRRYLPALNVEVLHISHGMLLLLLSCVMR